MANNTTEIIRRPRLFDRVELNGDISDASKLSRWDAFKSVFFGRFGTVVLLNILTALFAAPGAVVIILFYMNSTIAVGLLPYSANFGIGYPVITADVNALGTLTAFNYTVFEFLSLIPCIAFFAVGLAGNLHVMGKLAKGEAAKTFKDFFRGIKKSGLSALVVGLLFGTIVLSAAVSLGYADAYGLHVAVKVVSIIFSMTLLVFATMFLSYFMPQGATFKISVGVRIKNSLYMMFGAFFQTLVFVVLAIAPHLLSLIPGFAMFYVMLFTLIGISYTTLVFVINANRCFDVVLADKASDKTASYAKRAPEKPEKDPQSEPVAEKAPEPRKKQAPPTRYKNPKKAKRTSGENDTGTGD